MPFEHAPAAAIDRAALRPYLFDGVPAIVIVNGRLVQPLSADLPASVKVTTLAEEKRVNTFFRLQNPQVIARLRDRYPEIGEKPDAHTVFVKLRELRNKW